MVTKTVFIQNWEESERGWGTRPDGFTIHTSKEQLGRYVAWFNKTFNNKSHVPDEYTRVSGDPIEIEVTADLFDKIKLAANNKRDDGSVIDAVHGKEKFFETSPMRQLKDSDISWPTTPSEPHKVSKGGDAYAEQYWKNRGKLKPVRSSSGARRSGKRSDSGK